LTLCIILLVITRFLFSLYCGLQAKLKKNEGKSIMKSLNIITTAVILSSITLSGCANNLNTTQQNTLGGAVLGTAVGAGIGAVTGGSHGVGTGAAIGAAAGAVGGAMISD
jgi:uncharacterized protein YcfJ